MSTKHQNHFNASLESLHDSNYTISQESLILAASIGGIALGSIVGAISGKIVGKNKRRREEIEKEIADCEKQIAEQQERLNSLAENAVKKAEKKGAIKVVEKSATDYQIVIVKDNGEAEKLAQKDIEATSTAFKSAFAGGLMGAAVGAIPFIGFVITLTGGSSAVIASAHAIEQARVRLKAAKVELAKEDERIVKSLSVSGIRAG